MRTVQSADCPKAVNDAGPTWPAPAAAVDNFINDASIVVNVNGFRPWSRHRERSIPPSVGYSTAHAIGLIVDVRLRVQDED